MRRLWKEFKRRSGEYPVWKGIAIGFAFATLTAAFGKATDTPFWMMLVLGLALTEAIVIAHIWMAGETTSDRPEG